MLPRSTNEYRMTRPDLYPTGSGKTDPRAREGHYVRAGTEAEAHNAMRLSHPEDSHFTCELWKTWNAKGKQL